MRGEKEGSAGGGRPVDRIEVECYIEGEYGVEPEHPWETHPMHEVFRHVDNRKWFALVMEVPAEKLGIEGGGFVDVVNLKCDPLEARALQEEPGFYPAYHMNKRLWISVLLDGSVPAERVKALIDGSFELTRAKRS